MITKCYPPLTFILHPILSTPPPPPPESDAAVNHFDGKDSSKESTKVTCPTFKLGEPRLPSLFFLDVQSVTGNYSKLLLKGPRADPGPDSVASAASAHQRISRINA